MATVTPTLTLSSSDLLSDALSISTTTSITASHTSGLARAAITSTAKGTASGQVTIATAGEFTSPNYLFIKNTAAYHATNNIITLFDDTNSDVEIAYIPGGSFAFLPVFSGNTLKAFASTSGTVVEWMIVGTNA
tara:strand:+ start:302 stop:703 length:402 start_codon:yes stop_codon:yes gene_type:complete